MDHPFPVIPPELAVVLGIWLLAGLAVYAYVIRRVIKDGGKVSCKEFQEADFWVCGGFIVWFILTIGKGFGAAQHDVTQKDIVHGAAMFLGIVVLLGLFLRYRGIHPLRQFGILRNPLVCAGFAVGLLLSAYPLVLLTENLTALAMHGKAETQNVVEFFLNASERSDQKAVYLMLVLAVVVAPAAEETIFRGYLYGVLKRNVGGVAAGLFSAALFAAMHLNLSALPALFILALCLTLAYEATGSLLVNIFMHGLFNLSMLLAMLELARNTTSR